VIGAAAAAVVVLSAVTVLVVRVFVDDVPRCTSADLQVTTGGLTVMEAPAPIDSVVVSIRATRRCGLAGPLRLQVRPTNSASWSAVRIDPAPARESGGRPVGATWSQSRATLRLKPKRTYLIEIAWERKPALCPSADARLAGPALALPLASLPQWCGQPISMTNTFTPTVRYGGS